VPSSLVSFGCASLSLSRRALRSVSYVLVDLLGVREQVAVSGGTFQDDNRTEGGFRLRALLPGRGSPMIRVLIADDDALVRGGFR
jgi:hypothetical protein